MSIIGIGIAGYPITGYEVKKIERNGIKRSFADQAAEAEQIVDVSGG